MDASRAQIEIHERRLDEHDRKFRVLEGKFDRVAVEIGGVPDEIGRDPARESIRRRLHKLEGDRTAARTAEAAVHAAAKLHDAATEKRFTRREKIAALSIAAIAIAGPYVQPFLYHH